MIAFFWILWVLDLLLCFFVLVAKDFRSSFTTGDLNTWFSIVLFGSVIAAILLHLVFKKAGWALGMAMLPWLMLLFWYLWEKMSASQ